MSEVPICDHCKRVIDIPTDDYIVTNSDRGPDQDKWLYAHLPCEKGISDSLLCEPAAAVTMVILVADNDELRDELAEHLRSAGYPVAEYRAPSTLPALRGLRRVRLLIVDHPMDDEDALAFTERFHRAHATVPIVIVTSSWTASLQAAAQARDYLRVVSSPLDYYAFQSLVDQLIGPKMS